ncbi:MAG: zinc ribbon domain-containing protein [Pyrinomonadaceae bacterium]
MSAPICDRCGAQLHAEAKFCRQCGRPQASFAGNSKHESRLEAPTRTLDAHQSSASPTNRWQSPPTTPAYLAPQAASPPLEAAPAQTQSLQPKRKKGISLVGLAVIFMFLLVSLVAIGFVVDRVILRRVVREVSRRTDAPPIPPAPGDAGSAATDSALVYPGAQTTLDVDGDGEDKVRQLRTQDSFDKVVEWYTAQLKPTKTVRAPRINGATLNHTVLSNENITVVLTAQDKGTMILITQENKK